MKKSDVKVEFNKMVKEVNDLQQTLEKADKECGKVRYDLGHKLSELKNNKSFKEIYGTFEKLCHEYFHFSRQYGHRLIKLYGIQKELHDNDLVSKDTYLGSTMLMTLKRSDKPCEVWKLARKNTGNSEPSEAIVGQIIDEQNKQKTTCSKDMSIEIANATANNVCSVLQKIKNAKYKPSEEEQDKLITLLRESWSKKDVDTSTEEIEHEDIA